MSLERLRLGASSQAVALAEVSVTDLMANLSGEQKAGLAAQLAEAEPEGAAEEAAPSGSGDDKGKKKDKKDGGDEEEEEAPAGADAADPAHVQYGHGFAAAVERMSSVFASEHYEGREKAAARLLGNAKLTAEEIVATLADLPKGEGDGMLAELRSEENPDLGSGGGTGDGAKSQGSQAVWDKAIAANNPSKKTKSR